MEKGWDGKGTVLFCQDGDSAARRLEPAVSQQTELIRMAEKKPDDIPIRITLETWANRESLF